MYLFHRKTVQWPILEEERQQEFEDSSGIFKLLLALSVGTVQTLQR
jgi:hypothetical protein